ncbi:hypothetical protein, partial [Nostoc sp.]|uniref:hypothetical protein n=1 Tax=Nostoc sp. TaxID=1180 RepID=UPI002FF76ECF
MRTIESHKSLILIKSPKLLCVCAVRLGWTPARDVSLPHVSATGSIARAVVARSQYQLQFIRRLIYVLFFTCWNRLINCDRVTHERDRFEILVPFLLRALLQYLLQSPLTLLPATAT